MPVETKLAPSVAVPRRLIEQGGVRADGERVARADAEIGLQTGGALLLQVGKRHFLRVRGAWPFRQATLAERRGQMSEENKALVRRWFEEVWNRGRAEAIEELFAEDGVAHGLAGDAASLRGPAGFRQFHRSFRDAFPDIRVTVEEVIAEGDKVAALCSVRATHEGDTLGFAATGRPIEIGGMTFARVRDGKIVEAWNNFDFMALFVQIDAVEFRQPGGPAGADRGKSEGDA